MAKGLSGGSLQLADLVANMLRLTFPFSRFVSRNDPKRQWIIPPLALQRAGFRSKIRAFDVLTSAVGKGGEGRGEDPTTPLVIQMVPVACWEQPGSVADPTCGFNYSAWRGDAAEGKRREEGRGDARCAGWRSR